MFLTYLTLTTAIGHAALSATDPARQPRVDMWSVSSVERAEKAAKLRLEAMRRLGLLSPGEAQRLQKQASYYEMRAHMLKLRSWPEDRLDIRRYQKAMEHKRLMPGAPVGDYIGTGWTFFGPRNMSAGNPQLGTSPITGRVNAVRHDPLNPNTWWVGGATGGVSKTTNNGAGFSILADTWDYMYVSDIDVDPANSNRVAVATGDFPGWWGYGMGIMVTTNGGSIWTNRLRSELGGSEASDVMYSPDTSGVLLVSAGRGSSTAGRGVWRSTDSGTNWTRVLSQPSVGMARLAYSLRSNNVRNIYASSDQDGYVWRSRDDGATWQTAHLPVSDLGLVSIATSTTARDTVYAYSSAGSIYRSTNAGDSWTVINGNISTLLGGFDDTWRQTTYNYAFGVLNSQPDGSGTDVLLVGMVDIFVTKNPNVANPTWSVPFRNGGTRLIHADCHGFSRHPSLQNRALVGTDGGVWEITFTGISGAEWDVINKNESLRLTEHLHLSAHPDASAQPDYVLTSMWHNGAATSNNDPWNWQGVHGADGMYTAIDDVNPNVQFSSIQDLGQGGNGDVEIIATTNGWTSATTYTRSTSEDFPFITPWTEVPGESGSLYFAASRLWKSRLTGGVMTWNTDVTGSAVGPSGSTVTAIMAASASTVFLGNDVGEVRGALNVVTGGTPVLATLPGVITSIAVGTTDSDDLLVTTGNGRWPGGEGAVWEILDATDPVNRQVINRSGSGTTALPAIGANWIVRDPFSPGSTWYAATDLGVFYTQDRGANWFNATEPLGLPNALIYHLAVSDGYLYAGTFGRGVWRMALRTTAPDVTGFTFLTSDVTGGNFASATVTLASATPPAGLDVIITSNNQSAIPAQTVFVPGGRTVSNVQVRTNVVGADSTVTATALSGNGQASDSIIVRECSVLGMNIPNITGGNSAQGTVTLDRAAPVGGLDVDLVDNDPGTTVPATITVPAGATVGNFTVQTQLTPDNVVVGVQASGPGSGLQSSFTRLGVTMTGISVTPDPVWNTLPSGIVVTLNRPAPTSGFPLVIVSGVPSAATAPVNFSIPGGQSTGTVPITTFYVPTDTTAGFRVTDPYQGFLEDTLLVRNLSVVGLSFNPNPVVGGEFVTGTATVNRNVGSTPVTLNLSNNNPTLLQIPATVTIPANQVSGNFNGITNDPSSTSTATVEAQIGSQRVNGAYAAAVLTVLPSVVTVVPSSFTVNLGRLDAGNVASLATTDSNVLRVCRFIVPNQSVAPVTVEVNAVAPIGSASALEVLIRSRMTSSGLFSQTLDLFNWTTNTWDTVDTRTDSMSTAFTDRTLVGSGTLSRLLRADGALRMRYRARSTGPVASQSWCHEVDRLNWILRP